MSLHRVRRSLALLFCLLLAATASGQQPPAPPPADEPSQEPPIFRAEINFVRVDVIVTDRQGNPVTDLEASDFEIVEAGKPQEIESFRLVRTGEIDPDAPAPRAIRSSYDEETEAARDDVRLIAIFLDDYNVRLNTSMAVRDPLIRFIQTQLAPGDLLAVMYPLMPLSEVSFTRDHQSIISAIGRFQGRKYDYTPRNSFEEQYAFNPASVVQRIRNEVSLSALKALTVRLGGLREGRKAVILVSEGYSNVLPPQLRDPIAAAPGVGNPARRDPLFEEIDPRMESMEFFAQSDLLSDLREVYGTANRNNTAIYALDPRGLAPFEFDISEGVGMAADQRQLTQGTDTLRILAEETDGRAIVGTGDLDGGLRQIVRDSSTYYLLGYTSTEAPRDGQFHEIRVRVNRPGVQVRARPGYWAVSEEDAERITSPRPEGPPPAVTEALAAIAEPPGVRFIRTWVGTSKAEDGRTRVTFVWEPAPVPPGTRRDDPARVSLMAMGETAAYFRGRVPDAPMAAAGGPDGAPPGSAGASGAQGPQQVVFDADPGPLHLRLSVEGGRGEVLDSDVRELVLPDFGAPDVTISTPAVLRAGNARELQALLADADAVPTTVRTFSRTERLLVRFDAYGPGGSRPEVSARLLNRTGNAMTDLTADAAPSGGYQVDLPLAGLAAGEYLLEITARAGDAGDSTTLVALRVTS